jgi:hypothetical protein
MRPVSKPISVSVAQPATIAYEFLSLPENFHRWSSAWTLEPVQRAAALCLSEHNSRGVLDYALRWPSGRSFYVPLRVMANGRVGCDLVLTLFRTPGMSDEQFTAAAERARRDLLAAKGLLEAQRG